MEQFLRTQMLLGEAAMQRLQRSHVAVVGLGGVGSWCAEALARSGIGTLTLLDEDAVSTTNINRQSIALPASVGRAKAEVMAERIHSISPDTTVHAITARYEAAQRKLLFSHGPFDYIVDAIDLVACKLDLIVTAMERGIPIISALGTGNKLDASQLCICDISKTTGCPFSRVIRKELRARNIIHHTVVFSPEPAAKPEAAEAPPPGRRAVPGSVIWVPASAGMLLAQHVVCTISDNTAV